MIYLAINICRRVNKSQSIILFTSYDFLYNTIRYLLHFIMLSLSEMKLSVMMERFPGLGFESQQFDKKLVMGFGPYLL